MDFIPLSREGRTVVALQFHQNRKQHFIMEENIHKSAIQQPISFLKKQINEMVVREHKNTDTIRYLIDQFKAKQSSKEHFDRHQFATSAYKNFIEVQNLFQGLNTKIFAFPILEKLTLLLNTIALQYLHLFRFSNEKWQHQYKILQETLKSKNNPPPFRVDLCPNCSENKWHQQIKSEKHRIFNFRLEDPFYYFQEPSLFQKESNGEEIDHKILQQKLSELALGVQMEQRCLKELLADMHSQEKANENNLLTDHLSNNENITLPLMPMLRSVFNHARGMRKKFDDIGIQTTHVPQKTVKAIEAPASPQINELLAQKDKIQFKLITQLTDKTIQIKDLEEKISFVEKSQTELKLQHSVLLEENIILQKKNSILEVQLNHSRSKQPSAKVKILNKKKISENSKEDMTLTMNSKNYNSYGQPQPSNDSFRQKSQELGFSNKIRGNGSNDSKFKLQTQNKTMFIPNLYQAMRQSVTPSKLSSALSIDRSSAKLDDDGLTSIADFPSISPSIHTNEMLEDKIVGFKQPDQPNEKQNNNEESNDKKTPFQEVANKSRRKLKQITQIAKPQTSNTNLKEFVRSEDPSPRPSPRLSHQPEIKVQMRRKGKFQDRQSLLKMLFDEQIKENKERKLSFDYFRQSYETFVIKVIGINEFQPEVSKYSKLNHLQKKSTVSIKQYLRNENNESKDQLCIVKEDKSKTQQHRQSRYTKDSACLKEIMNNLFAQGVQIDPVIMDETTNERTILVKEQFSIMTQILAYMIQLKVSNLNSYAKVKTIISFQSGQHKKVNPQFQQRQQNKQLKNSLASLIKSHRKCATKAQGHNYCTHIASFIRNIIALIDK